VIGVTRWFCSPVVAGVFGVALLAGCDDRRPSAPAATSAEVDLGAAIRPLVTPTDLDPRKVALGERLFRDPRLSADDSIACSTCHVLESGGVDHRRFSVGLGGAEATANAPTVFNSSLGFRQFWDGRALTLEEQVDGPLTSHLEMGSSWNYALAKLSKDPSLVREITTLYPSGVDAPNLRNAIATFERSLITPHSRFDRYLAGERGAINEEETRGYLIFTDFGCVSCHQGAGIGGNMFQRFGVLGDYFKDRGTETSADLGRYNVTHLERDRHVFKVPSLRNVAVTAPYFHDGTAETLDAAVHVMARYQLARELEPAEAAALVAPTLGVGRFVTYAIAVLAMGVVTVLWQRTHAFDAFAANDFEHALRDLRRLDGTLNQDVLRARFRLVNSYDPLTLTTARLEALQPILDRPPPHLGLEATAALHEGSARYREAAHDKQRLIEDFESANSILQNSMRYFPTIATQLADRADATPQGTALGSRVRALLACVLVYGHTSDETLLADISTQLELLLADRQLYPAPLRGAKLDELAIHLRSVVTWKPVVDALVRRIGEAPTSARAEDVDLAYLAGDERADVRVRHLDEVMYGLSVLLLGLVAHAIVRLRGSARALLRANSTLETVIAHLPSGILAVDEAERVTAVNQTFCRLVGVPSTALVGVEVARALQDIKAAFRDPEALVERTTKLIARGEVVIGEELALADGRVVERDFVPILVDRAPVGRVWSFRDVTRAHRAAEEIQGLNEALEQRVAERTRELESTNADLASSHEALLRTQARLAVSDRMASVGTLAAGVAHEINNPLAYISANLELIVEELQKTDATASMSEIAKMAREASEGAGRVQRIVRSLKTFSRSDGEQRVPIDLHRVLEQSMTMAFNEIRHRARLEKDLGPVPVVEGDEGRLGQVFINLLMNAAQAIPVGHAQSNAIRVVTRTDQAGRAVVEVHDTGSGIRPEVLGHVFDPFFTTKPIGVGTGLGLSICHGIVAALNGEIAVESVLGTGSVFRVTLPAAGVADPVPVSACIASAALAGHASILIVDDDLMVRTALARALKQHDVTLAESGADALAQIRSKGTFHMILCDLMMPEMTGMDLHEAIGRTAPNLVDRMVFMTGGAFTAQAHEFLDRVPNQRMEKPFSPTELRAMVSRFLPLVALPKAS
jgi:PAS domain S-box-containing protein